MAVKRFRAVVGRKRLAASIQGDLRDNTLSARKDMAGIIRNYQALVNHIEDTTPEILLEALKPTYDKSQEYVPKDTGKLAESGYLEITTFRGKPTVEIGYGRGGNPEYAVAVHENLEWRHKSPTRAKWLQVALEEDSTELQTRIITAYRDLFR